MKKISLVLTVLSVFLLSCSIQSTESIKLKNEQRIKQFLNRNNKIYCGEAICSEPMKNVDVETFRVFNDSDYAKDKNRVYYPLNIMCWDSFKEPCPGSCDCTEYVIVDAFPATFRYIKKDYGTDGKSVFFQGKKVEDADATTIRSIKGPQFFYFAADINHIFHNNKILPNAEPKTFRYICDVGYFGNNKYIMRDKNHTWIFAPPNTIVEMKSYNGNKYANRTVKTLIDDYGGTIIKTKFFKEPFVSIIVMGCVFYFKDKPLLKVFVKDFKYTSQSNKDFNYDLNQFYMERVEDFWVGQE